jgi:hypothetical protein
VRNQALAVAVVALGVSVTAALTAAGAQGTVAPKAAPRAGCDPKTVVKGISAAFDQFLAGATATEKVRLVDQGAKIQDAVDKSTQAALAAGREKPPLLEVAANLAATCTAKSKATFSYDLQLRQASTGVTTPPLGLHQPGEAVLKKGTWYVTALTACAFAALNPDDANKAAVAECYQALGHDVPVPTS